MAIAAPVVIATLYPPVIDTYMPAQVYNSEEPLRVHFSLSDYNIASEINKYYTQVTISDQESNLSVLDKSLYPSEIMLKEMKYDDDPDMAATPYYIEIATDDGIFDKDKFYKVQIRFTNTHASAISTSTPQALDAWLTENLNNFSEWSRVTLIKWIAINTMTINSVYIEDETTVEIPVSDMNLFGELIFAEESKEYLNRYRIIITDENSNVIVNSGYIYSDKTANNVNEFWYKLKYALIANEDYDITIDYETNSLYTKTIEGVLSVVGDSGTDQGFLISAKENTEEGEITVRISRTSQTPFVGDLTIKRSSDESNFTIWEDVHSFSIKEDTPESTSLTYDWVDQTVESGTLYKYALLESYDDDGSTVNYLKNYDKILMLVLDDMYLTIANKQLKIKFNPQVSSFKQIVNEGKVETIGSPYPYIRRNAAINYAQFPISGLISCQMDENENFVSKEDLYGGKELLRKYEHFNSMDYNKPFMTTIDNDFVYEKKFRDAVKAFLMDGQVKLFRSATEGNYLVRLTDVSFTPNQQLGRMIWTFSATANEIADNTIDNYKKYQILK